VGIGIAMFGVGVAPTNYNNARVRLTQENQVTVEAIVNGERRNFARGTTLHDAIRDLGLEPAQVAVELNRQSVQRDLWLSTTVEAGAEIEIVQFVGGG
jgi:sulfur carrier protein